METHLNSNCFSSSLFFCFDRHFELSRGLPLYTCSQTPVPRSPFPVHRSPFPVPRSPFPVPRSPFPVPRSPFPVPRSPFPVPGISNILFLIYWKLPTASDNNFRCLSFLAEVFTRIFYVFYFGCFIMRYFVVFNH